MSVPTLAPSVVTSRDPKGVKFLSIVAAAYDKARLPEDEAQLVNEAAGLAEIVASHIEKNRRPNLYPDEEVRTSYSYPRGYTGPKPIADQIKAIAEIFGLDPASAMTFVKSLPAHPEGTEGWFAIPSVDALAAKHFPEVTDPAEKYCRAVQLVHQKIAKSRPFYNWRDGQIDAAHLRVSARTSEAMDRIAEQQKGDILIVAVQLGKHHGGRSVRRARGLFANNEFGLTSVAVGAIILVHPERIACYEELDIDCSGDEFSDAGGDVFGHAPYFSFYDDEVKFVTLVVSSASAYYGSASGFAPQ